MATHEGRTVRVASDDTGAYIFPDLQDGTWHLRVEMLGFATKEEDVTFAAGQSAALWELTMLSLDQASLSPGPKSRSPWRRRPLPKHLNF
jgi:hypothetical protein